MKIVKPIIFILLFLMSSCGYKVLNNLESYNFRITEFKSTGKKKINKILGNNFQRFSENSAQGNDIKIEANTKFMTSVVSKNNAGEPVGYEMIITVQINIFKNDNLLSNITFSKNTSYDNLNSKFELKQYENILIKDLTEQIVLQINNHINSIT